MSIAPCSLFHYLSLATQELAMSNLDFLDRSVLVSFAIYKASSKCLLAITTRFKTLSTSRVIHLLDPPFLSIVPYIVPA